MKFLFNKNYFNTFHIYKSIHLEDEDSSEISNYLRTIKLFQNNKVIATCKNIFIYEILTYKLLIKIPSNYPK